MKKTTLVLLLATTAFSLQAQIVRKWQGSQEVKVWDYATPNWLNPGSPLPIPTTFSEGAAALFDDSILREADTLKISGALSAASISVNASKNYVIRRTADTDVITGEGALIKEGSGSLVLDFKNELAGGTIVKGGVIVQERQNSPNVYGSKLVLEGGLVSMGMQGNGSSAYTISTVPIEIPAGKSAQIELPRYSTFASKLTGSGELDLLCTGERVHFGYTSLPAGMTSTMPDLSEFSGTIKVSKQVANFTPGFWGLILSTNKTFIDSLDGFNVDSTFYNKTIHLKSGATLASHSGTRAYAIGELQSEDETTVLCGYRSASTTPNIFFFVGGLNTDVVYPGRIAQAPGITSRYTRVNFVKMGTGTYTLTNPNNDMIGGLIVRQGTVLVSDPALPGNYTGGVGSWTIVDPNGTLGGTGRIQGNVDVHGTLAPGNNGVGTLLIRDTLSVVEGGVGGTRAFNLTMHPGSKAVFEIGSSTAYDKVEVSGALRFNNDEDAILAKPVLQLKLASDYDIKDGDRYEIISAKNIHASSQEYTVEFPEHQDLSWSIEVAESIEDPAHFKVIALVTGNASSYTGLASVMEKNVRLYPNPVQGTAHFTSTDAIISSIEIINLQGQVVMQQAVRAHQVVVNVSELQNGIYYARVYTAKGAEVHKMMVR